MIRTWTVDFTYCVHGQADIKAESYAEALDKLGKHIELDGMPQPSEHVHYYDSDWQDNGGEMQPDGNVS